MRSQYGRPIRYGDGSVEYDTQPWRQPEEEEEEEVDMARYEVLVPNIGTVERTNDRDKANRIFDYYISTPSERQDANEPVVLFDNGEPVREQTPRRKQRHIKRRKVAKVLTQLRNRRRQQKNKPLEPGTFYVTSFCNFPHRLRDGMPIRHECYQLDAKKLHDEREGREVKSSMIKGGPVRGVRR